MLVQFGVCPGGEPGPRIVLHETLRMAKRGGQPCHRPGIVEQRRLDRFQPDPFNPRRGAFQIIGLFAVKLDECGSHLQHLGLGNDFAQQVGAAQLDPAIAAYDFQKKLQAHKLVPSMSGKGNCYDNAAVETFFKSLKAEVLWRQNWPTRRQAETAIFQYINGFYNPRRRHSYLGGISPLAFEAKVA